MRTLILAVLQRAFGLAACGGALLLGLAPAAARPATEPLQGPIALFYGPDETHVVDVGTGARYRAEGYIASQAGQLWRYRVRVEAREGPRRSDGLRGEPNRWSVFEGQALGEARWTPLVAEPMIPALGRLTHEQRVVQFRGESVSLLSLRREILPERALYHAEGQTLMLPSGQPMVAPDPGDALRWLDAHLPGLVDPCVRRPAGRLSLELAGGRMADWLLLSGSEPRCDQELRGLALSVPPPAVQALGAAQWAAPHFTSPEGNRDDVVDLRASPDGQFALLVAAEPGLGPVAPERPVLLDPFEATVRPCAQGTLWRWQAGGAITQIGETAGLTGARWLSPDDPLLAWLSSEFLPLAASCHRPVALGQQGSGALGHRCRIVAQTRQWGGPADLDAEVFAGENGSDFLVVVRVTDPEHQPGDKVRFWLGEGRKPLQLQVDPQGWRILGGTEKGLASGARSSWKRTADGYEATLALSRASLGETPPLTIRVEDEDSEGVAWLWAGGLPIDSQNSRATPCVEGAR